MKKYKKLDLDCSKIILRPHPREKLSKFKKLEKKYLILKVRKNLDIIDEIVNSDVVIGCNSMAMVYALILKKRVYSFMPIKSIKNKLPYKKIIKI